MNDYVRSREETALISWYHILNVNVGIFTTVPLHQLKCFLYHITDIVIVSLGVVNAIAEVLVSVPE